MSVSPFASFLFDHGGPARTSQLRDIPSHGHYNPDSYSRDPQRMHSKFSSFRKSFSRKNSNPLNRSNSAEQSAPKSSSSRSGFLASQGNNPYSSAAPPTRRPNRPNMNAFSTPSNEPPPPYTPADNTSSIQSSTIAQSTASTADDPYDFLRSFDTIFVIDDSGSMAGRSWRETQEALKTITPICTQRDADGIDIHFLNHKGVDFHKNVKRADTVVEIFQTVRPSGGTPTGQRLDKILRPYLRQYQRAPDATKPINVIVITDGAASDDVESPIIHAAETLDNLDAPSWQVGIQFFQVGREPEARTALKRLDDNLREASGNATLRDIVDTVPFTGEDGAELSGVGIMKCVLGAVNRRLDRNSRELHRRA